MGDKPVWYKRGTELINYYDVPPDYQEVMLPNMEFNKYFGLNHFAKRSMGRKVYPNPQTGKPVYGRQKPLRFSDFKDEAQRIDLFFNHFTPCRGTIVGGVDNIWMVDADISPEELEKVVRKIYPGKKPGYFTSRPTGTS